MFSGRVPDVCSSSCLSSCITLSFNVFGAITLRMAARELFAHAELLHTNSPCAELIRDPGLVNDVCHFSPAVQALLVCKMAVMADELFRFVYCTLVCTTRMYGGLLRCTVRRSTSTSQTYLTWHGGFCLNAKGFLRVVGSRGMEHMRLGQSSMFYLNVCRDWCYRHLLFTAEVNVVCWLHVGHTASLAGKS